MIVVSYYEYSHCHATKIVEDFKFGYKFSFTACGCIEKKIQYNVAT